MTRIAAYPTPTERRANRFDPVAHPVQFKRTQEAGQRRRQDAEGAAAAGGRGGLPAAGRRRASQSAVERDILYSTGATRSQRYYYADPFSSRLKPRQDYDSALLITQQMTDSRRPQPRPDTASSSCSSSGSRRPRTAPPAPSSSRKQDSRKRAAVPAEEEKRREPETAEPLQGDSEEDGPGAGGEEGDAYSRLYCTLLNVLLLHRISRQSAVDALLARAVAVNDHLDPVKLRSVCEAVRQNLSRRADDEETEAGAEQRLSGGWQRGRGEEADDSSDSVDSEVEDESWESKSEDEQSAASEQQGAAEQTAAGALPLRDRDDGLPDSRAAETADTPESMFHAAEAAQPAAAEDEQDGQQEEQEAAGDSELTTAAAAAAEPVEQAPSPRRQPQTIEEGEEEEQTYEEDYEEEMEEQQ